MTDDKGYDGDNRWGVGFELIQKAYYYNYCFTQSILNMEGVLLVDIVIGLLIILIS